MRVVLAVMSAFKALICFTIADSGQLGDGS